MVSCTTFQPTRSSSPPVPFGVGEGLEIGCYLFLVKVLFLGLIILLLFLLLVIFFVLRRSMVVGVGEGSPVDRVRITARKVVRGFLLPLHPALGKLFHHLNELSAVVLEEVIGDGEYAT